MDVNDRIALLEARMAELEAENGRLRRQIEQQTAPGRAPEPDSGSPVEPDPVFGRRHLLGRLGQVAVVGVGLAALEGGLSASPVAADSNSAALFGDGGANKDGVEGVAASASRSGVYGHHVGAGVGVYGSSTTGTAIFAQGNGSGRAIDAVAPTNGVHVRVGNPVVAAIPMPTAGAMFAESYEHDSVIGMSTRGTGLVGASLSGAGVSASSDSGPAITATARGEEAAVVVTNPRGGGLGLSVDAEIPFEIVPNSLIGAPFSAPRTRRAGQMYVDALGDIYVCTAGGDGRAATWRKVSYGGASVLTTPVRLMDSRGGAPVTHANQKVGVGEIVTVQVTGTVPVPSEATGITGSIAVTQPEGAGYLRLFPAQLSGSGTSVINFASGQTIATGFTVALSSGGALKVQAVQAKTHVVIDVTGYLT